MSALQHSHDALVEHHANHHRELEAIRTRLQSLERAARELQEDLFDWDSSMHFGAGDPTTLVSYQNMKKLLEGDK